MLLAAGYLGLGGAGEVARRNLFRRIDRGIDRLKADHDVGQGEIRVKLDGLAEVLHGFRAVEILQFDQTAHEKLARSGGFGGDEKNSLLAWSGFKRRGERGTAHDENGNP